MKRKLVYNEKYWRFTREVLLEIKKQEKKELNKYPKGDAIAYNVALMLDKDNPIPIESLGKY